MSILPDLLEPDLKVVFCGTAAGDKSAQVGAYYAGPGNAFWIILRQIGLTPYQLEPQAFRSLVQYGIGLTDLAQHTSGVDYKLNKTDFDIMGFRDKITYFKPKFLTFNGKRAAQEFYGQRLNVNYGLQPDKLIQSAVFVLPSTSGAAQSFWDETYWFTLANFLMSLD